MIKMSNMEKIVMNEVGKVFKEFGGRFYPHYTDDCLYGIDHNPNNDTLILVGYVTTLDGVVVATIRFNEMGENEFVMKCEGSEFSLSDEDNNDEMKLLSKLFENRKYLIKSLSRINSRLLM